MAMSEKPILPGPDGIEPINLKDALEERYLAYALSTIMHRALPDVRDGLKPVHRRILYAMHQLRLTPDGGFLKCAKIVGDAMGDYHPHGNQAIYDALARLAQDFAVRYPLIDGQGNFGNVDGDNAAAMRYTEARLTEVARLLIDGINEDTVDFRPTYDGTSEEPVVLPAAFPNLLANGSLANTTLPGGVKTRLPLLPFQMFGWRPPLVSDPPEIGQHNDEVLRALGYDGAGIAGLRTAGLLGPK